MPALRIDRKNFDHLVDTARLVLERDLGDNSRELAEIFLGFAVQADLSELVTGDAVDGHNLRVQDTFDLQDQSLLTRIALGDPDWCAREAATSRLQDQSVLAKVAVEDARWEVGQVAVLRLQERDLLGRVAVEASRWEVRQSAVLRLQDQSLLAKIVAGDRDSSVRLSAGDRLRSLSLVEVGGA